VFADGAGHQIPLPDAPVRQRVTAFRHRAITRERAVTRWLQARGYSAPPAERKGAE